MTLQAVRPSDVVRLAIRNGENVSMHNALVLAVDPLSPLTSEDGYPSIELVSVNTSALHHAGTADFDRALTRGISVVNVNHKDFVEGRASLGWMALGAGENEAAANVDTSNIVQRAAMAAHEANRLLCAAQGDYSQKPWDLSPQWQKDSAVMGVSAIVADPSMTPERLHESWSKQKLADGWKYGPVKDAEKKEHPCLIPYDGLPKEQQLKDYMFGLVVRSVLDIPMPAAAEEPETAGTPSAADLDAVAEEAKAKAATEATKTEFEKLVALGGDAVKTVYAIFVDGVQKGDCVAATATLQKADGTIVPIIEVKEGDALEGGIAVKSVVPVVDDAVVNIICEHAK